MVSVFPYPVVINGYNWVSFNNSKVTIDPLSVVTISSISYPLELFVGTILNGVVKSLVFSITFTPIILPLCNLADNFILLFPITFNDGAVLYPLPPVVMPI